MEIAMLVIVPCFLVCLECLFLRTCIVIKDIENDKKLKIPRIVILGLIVLSLIPFLGIVVAIAIPVVTIESIFDDKSELSSIKNRIKRFWFVD
jgi:hypothetical protein